MKIDQYKLETTTPTKLTIILQYKDRYDFMCRWINFAYQHSCTFDIYLADGSDNQLIKNYIKTNKISSKLKIKYVKTKFDSSWNVYCQKVLKALKSIDTPYVILADDDDFYNFETLQKCIDKLDQDKSLTTCGGQTLHFKILDGIINGKKIQYNKTNKSDFKNNSIMQNIKSYFTINQNGVYYNVHRTEDFRNGWIINNKHKLSPRMSELFIELYVLTCGKIEFIPLISYYRQFNHPYSNSNDLSNDFLDEMLSFNWYKEINIVFNIISKKLTKSNNIKSEVVKEDLISDYKIFLRPWIINNINLEGKLISTRRSRILMIKNGLKYGRLKYCYKLISMLKNYFNLNLVFRKKTVKEYQIISEFLNNYKI